MARVRAVIASLCRSLLLLLVYTLPSLLLLLVYTLPSLLLYPGGICLLSLLLYPGGICSSSCYPGGYIASSFCYRVGI